MKFFVPFSLASEQFSRTCRVVGSTAEIQLPFYGRDIIFTPNNVFLYSKSALIQFTQLFVKLSTSAVSGCFVELLLVGLGFRLMKLGGVLLLKLGFSHYIKLPIPTGVHVIGYKKRLIIFGAYAPDVNQFMERLVRFRKPDVYKNKGVQVVGRLFRLKVGKQK
jgi:large subunit ribosomal protein L6